ncbi:aldehyde ferredoxin oxidoreductase C-terminal domain-containing protein, partial [bacterium]|nr:aldehyde ferredoxin oxidoreductase C-terminal domain-containing protein [bacterium]
QEENWNLEKHDRLFGAFRNEFNTRKVSCFCCPAQGSRFYIVNEGPYAGLTCEGMELNTMRAFGPNLDIDYPPALIKGQALCSQLGIDVDSAAAVLGWAFESYQRGVITNDDTNGLNLTWGNYKAALRLLEDIAFRRGLGDLLAQGVKKASETVGRGSEQWALHIKGADQNEWRMRYDKAWALAIVVALRGGGHSEGAPVLSICAPQLTPERAMSLWGVSDVGFPQDYKNKAHVVYWIRKLKAVVDALGMCFITSPWYDLTDTNLLQLEDYTALLNAGTGMSLTREELMKYGQRIYNIEKAFNTLHTSLSRKDDMPPPRFMNEPIKSGEFAGNILHREGLEQMLDQYYQLEGWKQKNGLQTEHILSELGLQDVAEKLKTYGKLR